MQARHRWIVWAAYVYGVYLAIWSLFDPINEPRLLVSLAAAAASLVIALLIARKRGLLIWISSLGISAAIGSLVLGKLSPHIHQMTGPWMLLLGLWAKLLGLRTIVQGSHLQIIFGRDWVNLLISPELLGIWSFLILLGVVAPIFVSSGRWDLLAGRTLACLGIVMPVCTILFSVVSQDLQIPVNNAIAYNLKLFSTVLILTFGTTVAEQSRVFRLEPRSLFLIALGMTIVIASCRMDLMGSRRPLRVVVDNGHGSWEPIDEPMNESDFGRRSSYTYSNMVELLSHYGEVTINEGGLTADTLRGCSVLILKTPSKPFAAGEITAVRDFVRDGGGLLVLGDHTNLFGMNTYLNEVLSEFGIQFENNDTWDMWTGGFARWDRRWTDLTPLSATMPTHMRLETSCSVTSSPLANDLVVCRSMAAEPADWSNPGFFGNLTYDSSKPYGSFAIAISKSFYKGRVLAFGDSTLFSGFSIYFPGRREVLLTWIDMLSRHNPGLVANAILLLLGLCLAVVGIWRWHPTLEHIALATAVAAFAALAFIPMYYRLSLSGFRPIAPLENLAFVDAMNYQNPEWGTALGEAPMEFGREFSTFFVCAERVGFDPIWEEQPSVRSDVSAMVIVDPSVVSTAKNLKILEEYCDKGCRILLLVDGDQDIQTVQVILDSTLGTSRTRLPCDIPDAVKWTNGVSDIIVFTNKHQLTRAALGKVDSIPTQEQESNYLIAFRILKEVK